MINHWTLRGNMHPFFFFHFHKLIDCIVYQSNIVLIDTIMYFVLEPVFCMLHYNYLCVILNCCACLEK